MAASGDVNVIHNHGLWMMPNVYSGRAASKYGVALVTSPEGTLSTRAFGSGTYAKRLFWPLVQKPALKATACFHATADSEYKDIRRMGFRQPVAIIPNGVDIPELQPKTAGDFRTVLFLGRLHPIKGLDLLLPAWAAVHRRFPEWQLKVVGPDEGGYLREVQQLASRLNLKRLEFVGSLSGLAKWQAYQDADLFVLPSHSENFGMTVAEALASGTPAIVTAAAPWAGLQSHQAGWWIDVGVESLVACLSDALSRSTHELTEMGERGRAWMKRDFSWSQIGMQMLETYRWILGGQASDARPTWVTLD